MHRLRTSRLDRAVLFFTSVVLLHACTREAPSMQPAPPMLRRGRQRRGRRG